MRVYIPLTLEELRALVSQGRCSVSHGYVCSAALLALAGGDDEAEYLATSLAAAHSRVMQRGRSPRVVLTIETRDVVAAQIPQSPLAAHVDEDLLNACSVTVSAPVSMHDVVCVHVDAPGTSPGESDDPLDQAMDLLWFGPMEISAVLATYPADGS